MGFEMHLIQNVLEPMLWLSLGRKDPFISMQRMRGIVSRILRFHWLNMVTNQLWKQDGWGQIVALFFDSEVSTCEQ